MAQTTRRGTATEFFQKVVSSEAFPPECIIWPFARNEHGYGVFGKRRGEIASALVSRVICAEVHGMPPDRSYEAAHSCGNGHLGCINPRHLKWKTSKQNKDDQIRHGTRNYGERNGRSHLTAEKVKSIRSMSATMRQRDVAKHFNIDPSTVSDIVHGKRWGHVQ